MSDDSSKDHRTSPRAEILLKVEYHDAEGFLQDYTVNISRGGTMIRVNRELSESDRVELILSFPGLLAPITLTGIVRWVQREDAGDVTAGVEFEEQDPVEWTALDSLVLRIKAGDRSVLSPVIRILLIEDNLHVARLISDGLNAYLRRSKENIAFETRHASNGREALTLLAEASYDVLLVDMFLPVMDGEALIREVRQNPQWERLPIIALSAGGTEIMEQAIAAGADFFLDKPIRLSDVLSTMNKLMATRFGPEKNGFPEEDPE
jgi:uncharacterized protein (TIGR02266 family)